MSFMGYVRARPLQNFLVDLGRFAWLQDNHICVQYVVVSYPLRISRESILCLLSISLSTYLLHCLPLYLPA